MYAAHLIRLAVVPRHQSNSQHQLLCVVVVEDAIQILSKVAGDLVRDLLHRQLLVRHPLAVQLETEEPGGDARGVKVGHLVVHVDKFLVLLNDRVEGLGVVVDGSVGRNLAQGCVLNTTQDILNNAHHHNPTLN